MRHEQGPHKQWSTKRRCLAESHRTVETDNIRRKLEMCIDPLDSEDHPKEIVNTVSRRIAQDSVNANKSVTL